MKKGDLFSMRISATFLYAYIYPRLNNEKKEYTRHKFAKLVKDDTPMVRRGAAQSISIFADSLEKEYAQDYLLPLLKSLLQDDNDSVKIHAVYSSVTVARLLENPQITHDEIIPAYKIAVENKNSWRLRFSIAEMAATLA